MEALSGRERNKARVRDALVEAASQLFAKRGFAQTTVDDIVAAADVSRRTFFRYFETKEAIAMPEHPDRLVRFRRLLAETPDAPPFERVRNALIAIAQEHERSRAAILAEQRVISAAPTLVTRELEWDRQWEAAMADTLANGARGKAAQRDARLLAGATIGVVRAALREWFEHGGSLVRLGHYALDGIDPSRQARTQS